MAIRWICMNMLRVNVLFRKQSNILNMWKGPPPSLMILIFFFKHFEKYIIKIGEVLMFKLKVLSFLLHGNMNIHILILLLQRPLHSISCYEYSLIYVPKFICVFRINVIGLLSLSSMHIQHTKTPLCRDT